MIATFALYEQMTALDLVSAYQVVAAIPGMEVKLAASTPGPKRTDTGMTITADVALRDVSASDLVIVPGTGQPQAAAADRELIAWLANIHGKTTWTGSVCTGALLLGAAGILRGRRATTHWMAMELLPSFGATPVHERVVFDDRVVTCAGVSAGIDMGLELAARIASAEVAQTIQLVLEYDPKPPFDAGSPKSAPPNVLEMAKRSVLAAAG
jgi:transcriptional regulator GlxA family with amidase domain